MRHHGGVAATCPHGFAAGTCLICQTLDVGNSGGGGSRGKRAAETATEVPRPKHRDGGRVARMGRSPATDDAGGPRVIPPSIGRSRFPAGVWVVGGLFAVVLVAMVAWTLVHVVFAVLRILELVAAALVAGYIGWVAGVRHGRREARRQGGRK
jgi:hypothetical protein